MSKPKIFTIKESIAEIKKLIKSNDDFLAQRLKVLLECKRHEQTGISKRDLCEATGYSHTSVQEWRKSYINGGINALLSHKKTGFKPSSFSKTEHEQLHAILHDDQNGIVGYKELQKWLEENANKTVQYQTLYAYVRRNFGAKIKVARKSHVKKDIEAVESFKKTSSRSAKRQ